MENIERYEKGWEKFCAQKPLLLKLESDMESPAPFILIDKRIELISKTNFPAYNNACNAFYFHMGKGLFSEV